VANSTNFCNVNGNGNVNNNNASNVNGVRPRFLLSPMSYELGEQVKKEPVSRYPPDTAGRINAAAGLRAANPAGLSEMAA